MTSGFVIGDRGLGSAGDTHPDWMMAHGVMGNYLVVGASAIGQLHLARGFSRGDAFVIRSAGPWLAVAVSDGVGSRPLSRFGSTYVAEVLSTYLLRQLLPPLTKNGLDQTCVENDQLEYSAPPASVEKLDLMLRLLRLRRDNRRHRSHSKSLERLTVFTNDKSGTISLAVGLLKWTQSIKVTEYYLPNDLVQTASISWWLPPAKSKFDILPTPETLGIAPLAPEYESDSHTDPLTRPKMGLSEIVIRALIDTHLGLRQHAKSLKLDLSDLSCTALALLLNTETGQLAVGQVGDGAVLGMTTQGRVEELSQSLETGDPQSTYTLTMPNFARYAIVKSVANNPKDPYVALYIMTDGLAQDLLYSPEPSALEDWAKKVDGNLRASLTPAQAAAGMLNWLATYVVRGSWDDRTLIVITQRER